MHSPSLFCIGKFVIYISDEVFILPLHLNYIYVCIVMFVHFYNGACIDMLVHLIMVYVLLCICMLYNLNVGYTSYWCFILYPVYGLFRHCVIVTSVFVLSCFLMLYMWLLRYFCVLHMIFSLVALHLGNIGMHSYCILFVVPLLPSSLTYIHDSVLINPCFN